MEVVKLVEGQSRYGIMEELNNRKINEKEKLANIERETDNRVYDTEKQITAVENQVNNEEKVYEQRHKDKVRELSLKLSMIQSEYKRIITDLEAVIKDEKDSYQKRFIDWKNEMLGSVVKTKEGLTRYKDIQQKKIDEKKEIIEEIEKGVSSLKEMSKEQKE